MLDHETTMTLLKEAKGGSDSAKETLIRENEPLVKSIIKRFCGRGVEYDDLYQLACVGFIKAINNFDDNFEVKFSTYAVPMIMGEVKRFLRDDGAIKVSRSIKLQSYKIARYIDEYQKKNNKKPKLSEIAKEFNIEETEVVYSMDANKSLISIYENQDDDNKSSSLMEKLSDNYSESDALDKIILKEAIKGLSERERKIIVLRYFRDKTQSEIAKHFGLSQVQISRIESKIVEKIKSKF